MPAVSGARPKQPEARLALPSVSRSRFTVIALVSLLTTALLGLAVAHGYRAHRLERQAIQLLGNHPDVGRWADLADLLAVPVIAAVLIVSLVFGALRRVLVRVALFAGLAAAALLISEQIVKPAVQERIDGQLSFPSGHVTAVCATALAMWIALYPVLGKWARSITFVLGAAWTFLMSLAVVGAYWHTPLDAIGSIFLSVGVVTAGAAIFRPKPGAEPVVPVEPARVLEGV